MPKIPVAKRLSDNLSLTRENYLLCSNVPIARTGVQFYRYNEGLCDDNGLLPPNSKGIIEVTKPAEVLFSKETMDSFENKPVTLDHLMLNPKNYKQGTVGMAFNIRRGEGRFKDNLMADLLIQDQKAIDIIQNNKMREISLGYEAAYVSDGAGKAHQTAIIGNHVAIVSQGKAGPLCRIYDSKSGMRVEVMASLKEALKKMFTKTVDSIDLNDWDLESLNQPSNGNEPTLAQTTDVLPNQPQAPAQPSAPAQPTVPSQPQAPAQPSAPAQPQTIGQQILAKLDYLIQQLQEQSASKQGKESNAAPVEAPKDERRVVSLTPTNPMNK